MICPKCEHLAEHIGNDWYTCLWRDCSQQNFHLVDAGKIDPNKFKAFRDSIKPKTTMCDDDMVDAMKISISSSSSASIKIPSPDKKIKYHPNRQQNTE